MGKGRTGTQKGSIFKKTDWKNEATLYTRLQPNQKYKVKRLQESYCFLKDTNQDISIYLPYEAEDLEKQKDTLLAKSWGLCWLQKQKVMGSATQLRPLQMKYRHTGAKSEWTKVLLTSPESDGKKTLEEGRRKTGKEGRNFREMTTKTEDTIIKCKANISSYYREG